MSEPNPKQQVNLSGRWGRVTCVSAAGSCCVFFFQRVLSPWKIPVWLQHMLAPV